MTLFGRGSRFDLGIPAQLRAGLESLASLTPDQAAEVVGAVSSAEPFKSVRELEAVVRDALPSTAKAPAERIVASLISLSSIARSSDIETVSEAVSQSDRLELDDEARAALRGVMDALLRSKAVFSTASAIELLTQHPQNFRASRVVTDIRPVFAEDASEPPMGAVLIQTLQLQTWDRNGDSETLYVAMDEADLRELRDDIERAIGKTATLRAMLDEQGVAYFQLDEKEN
jgi:hypothetical protein